MFGCWEDGLGDDGGTIMGSDQSGSFVPFVQQSNAGAGAAPSPMPDPFSPVYNCSPAYIAKYQQRFGVRPAFCGIGPVINPPIPVVAQPAPIRVINPPIPVTAPPIPVPSPPPSTGRRSWHRPPSRPIQTRTDHDRDADRQRGADGGGEICPIMGYVQRPIPGANEYQNFKCTPGEPVVINQALARAGAAGAYARQGYTPPGAYRALARGSSGGSGYAAWPGSRPRYHQDWGGAPSGLHGLDHITLGGTIIPTWAIIGAAGVAAWFILGKRRR